MKDYVKKKDLVKEKNKREREFVTSGGITFLLHGLPPLLIPELTGSIQYPVKPTYSVTTASGDTEIYEHDEKSLSTDEDKAAWNKYTKDLAKADAELTQMILKTTLIYGVKIIDREPMKQWEERRALIGMLPAKSDEERDLAYKQICIGCQDDIAQILEIAMELTGVTAEAIEAAKSTFQGSLESIA